MGKKSLGEIIRWYKGRTKFEINKLADRDAINRVSTWQSRYYDHIIRNEKSLMKIREYIRNNPLRWELDRNNPENLFM